MAIPDWMDDDDWRAAFARTRPVDWETFSRVPLSARKAPWSRSRPIPVAPREPDPPPVVKPPPPPFGSRDLDLD